MPTNSQDWPCYVADFPAGPDNPDIALAILIKDVQGRMGRRDLRPPFFKEVHPGFQILVRGPDHTTAYDKAFAITQILDQVSQAEIIVTGGVASRTYILYGVTRMTDPIPMDDLTEGAAERLAGRKEFIIDGRVTVQPKP